MPGITIKLRNINTSSKLFSQNSSNDHKIVVGNTSSPSSPFPYFLVRVDDNNIPEPSTPPSNVCEISSTNQNIVFLSFNTQFPQFDGLSSNHLAISPGRNLEFFYDNTSLLLSENLTNFYVNPLPTLLLLPGPIKIHIKNNISNSNPNQTSIIALSNLSSPSRYIPHYDEVFDNNPETPFRITPFVSPSSSTIPICILLGNEFVIREQENNGIELSSDRINNNEIPGTTFRVLLRDSNSDVYSYRNTELHFDKLEDEDIVHISFLKVYPRVITSSTTREIDTLDTLSSASPSQSNFDIFSTIQTGPSTIHTALFFSLYRKSNQTELIGVCQFDDNTSSKKLYPYYNVVDYKSKVGIEMAGKDSLFVFQTKRDFPWDSSLIVRGRFNLEGGTVEKDLYVGKQGGEGIKIIPEYNVSPTNTDSLICGSTFDPENPVGNSWGIYGSGKSFFTDIYIGNKLGHLIFRKKQSTTNPDEYEFILRTENLTVDTPNFKLSTVTTDTEKPYLSFFQKKTSSPDEIPFEFIRIGYLRSINITSTSTPTLIPTFGISARNSSSTEILRIEEDNSNISGYDINEWHRDKGLLLRDYDFSSNADADRAKLLWLSPMEGLIDYSKNSVLKIGTHYLNRITGESEKIFYIFSDNSIPTSTSPALSLLENTITEKKQQIVFIIQNRLYNRRPSALSDNALTNTTTAFKNPIVFNQNSIFLDIGSRQVRHWIRSRDKNTFRLGLPQCYIGQITYPDAPNSEFNSIILSSIDGILYDLPQSTTSVTLTNAETYLEVYYGIPYIEKTYNSSSSSSNTKIKIGVLKSKTCSKNFVNVIKKEIVVLIELNVQNVDAETIILWNSNVTLDIGNYLTKLSSSSNIKTTSTSASSTIPILLLGKTNSNGIIEFTITWPSSSTSSTSSTPLSNHNDLNVIVTQYNEPGKRSN